MLNPSPALKPASWALELAEKTSDSYEGVTKFISIFHMRILIKLLRITARKWYGWNLNPDISNAKAVGHFTVCSFSNFPRSPRETRNTIQYPFTVSIKMLSKLRKEWKFLHPIKDIYKQNLQQTYLIVKY